MREFGPAAEHTHAEVAVALASAMMQHEGSQMISGAMEHPSGSQSPVTSGVALLVVRLPQLRSYFAGACKAGCGRSCASPDIAQSRFDRRRRFLPSILVRKEGRMPVRLNGLDVRASVSGRECSRDRTSRSARRFPPAPKGRSRPYVPWRHAAGPWWSRARSGTAGKVAAPRRPHDQAAPVVRARRSGCRNPSAQQRPTARRAGQSRRGACRSELPHQPRHAPPGKRYAQMRLGQQAGQIV
ncbi:MAG: hypothetical protein HLUCCO18_03125 [Rhodobacteraceae bacterium HLUCCO18]|nr:MAG: hypothetical protein HLUCCO18_03125 [Rhodobacteraceae bacterium HLUCCO18]